MFYVTPLGEGSWMLAANFLQILPYMSFPFVDCALYLLTIINHSYKYNYTLNSVSPSKSPNVGVVLGIPNNIASSFQGSRNLQQEPSLHFQTTFPLSKMHPIIQEMIQYLSHVMGNVMENREYQCFVLFCFKGRQKDKNIATVVYKD